MQLIRSLPLQLLPNEERVVVRPLQIAPEPNGLDPVRNHRAERIVAGVRSLDRRSVEAELSLLLGDFGDRHRELRSVFEDRYEQVAREIGLNDELIPAQRELIGAYFCHEYAFEAAALMNPSIVPHPDQSGLKPGDLRFVLSLRGVGEGHYSSISFREGILSADGTPQLLPEAKFAFAAKPDSGTDGAVRFRRRTRNTSLDEMVLFPSTPAQGKGLEDLRLVRFTSEHGEACYYGTYTAYSGDAVASELLSTRDFDTFDLRSLRGDAARNKGMALFPRKLGGDFLMIGRQDNENLFLLRSPDLYRWETSELIARPEYSWELVQIGNCGSPIELDEGWLVLTHGVGPMRKYSIGAMLLDKDDPTRIIGRSPVPILSPGEARGRGYVPNVVYTCGALAHEDRILMPYGVADKSVHFATIDVRALLASLAPPGAGPADPTARHGDIEEDCDA